MLESVHKVCLYEGRDRAIVLECQRVIVLCIVDSLVVQSDTCVILSRFLAAVLWCVICPSVYWRWVFCI